jgi:hypothetical protein
MHISHGCCIRDYLLHDMMESSILRKLQKSHLGICIERSAPTKSECGFMGYTQFPWTNATDGMSNWNDLLQDSTEVSM